MEGDIGHVSDVLLVLGNVLGGCDDVVGHVAVAAPAGEGPPVLVQVAPVDGAAHAAAPVQDKLHEVGEGDLAVGVANLVDNSGVELVRLVHQLVLEGGHQSVNRYLNTLDMTILVSNLSKGCLTMENETAASNNLFLSYGFKTGALKIWGTTLCSFFEPSIFPVFGS